MNMRRRPISRPFAGTAKTGTAEVGTTLRPDAPRQIRKTIIDFTSLRLPKDIRVALAEAFWAHYGVQCDNSIQTHWGHVRTFDRFVTASRAVEGVSDLDRALLVKYVEWLNQQCRPDGKPWGKVSRAAAYTTLRMLLQWLARCRPGTIAPIDFPFSPFPCRDRDSQPQRKIDAVRLRAILCACEDDIARLRADRDAASEQRAKSDGSFSTLGGLLLHIDTHFGGIVPTNLELPRNARSPASAALTKFGGTRCVEPCIYPRSDSLLPYYLAILIHTAGNPESILGLQLDCLQSIPLLDDRLMLVWRKGRTPHLQRRTFSIKAPFEPPALVREVHQWTERLRPLAPASLRDCLFLFKSKGCNAVSALSASVVKRRLREFCLRHGLEPFSVASIRPSVLSAFYRYSGDLSQVKTVANHARLSTTVRYVDAPEVQTLHRVRMSALQNAFVGHIGKHRVDEMPVPSPLPDDKPPDAQSGHVSVMAVSMFGFDCTDPLAGVAPGTHPGGLCTNFMGCFTCPNAVITPEPWTIARLLQAREHLRAAILTIHPARWRAVYAPVLQILEEDILPRFTASEIAAAEPEISRLAPLPELR